MKFLHFIFKDHWRKLIALIFTVVLYWSEGGFAQTWDTLDKILHPPVPVKPVVEKIFPVQVLGTGNGLQIVFSEGDEPEVTATLSGNVDNINDGDLRFYVDAEDSLKPGMHKLKVYYHIRRSDVHVESIEPDEKEVSVIENPDNDR